MSVKLEGNILVTGTNRGIGLELVRQLAETTGEQAHIYACCRAPEGPRAEALRDLPTQYPGKITIIKLDMSDEDSISAAVQAVSKQIGAGGLNLLINNAAITKPAIPGPLSATRKKDMMEVYETNVVGPFLIGKVFLPLLRRAAEMDSLEKDQGNEVETALITAALNMLTRCQAEDFKSYNILVTAIHPGWVRTEMGGEEAPMTAKESAESLISLMSSLSNKDCGMLLDWEGVRIPW
ncbi:C-factor isoform X3 [Epinephelus moara]|uniref:C-factor isoform X3 n=1 Tax=Epinephelus moara TaxID=300413 RepID=UPI00214E7E9D|nr:C-factor isoform X3 [Epinephelus moara]